jgi:hypothetical protein
MSESEAPPQNPPDEYEYVYQLISRLSDLTSQGRIAWEPTPNRSDRITYSGQSATVFLESADRDALPPIIFRLRDAAGAEICTWTTDPGNVDPVVRKWAKALHKLYDNAHHQAMRLETVVENFLQELGEENGGS